jgi:hypothetical protein
MIGAGPTRAEQVEAAVEPLGQKRVDVVERTSSSETLRRVLSSRRVRAA